MKKKKKKSLKLIKPTSSNLKSSKSGLILPKTPGLLNADGSPMKKVFRKFEEQKENRRLCIYAPVTWPFVYTRFFKNVINILHPSNIAGLHKLGITDYFTLIHGKFPVCRNRNEAVMIAKKNEADLIMFLDADMTHPMDIIYKLAKHNLPIVAGIYFHQSPPNLPVIYKRKPSDDNQKPSDDYQHYYDYPRDKLFDVDLTGMGCMLVDMRVFDEMEMPYFGYDSSREDGLVDISEDVLFCKQALKADHSIVIDPTVKCTHYYVGEIGEEMFDAFMRRYQTYNALLDKFGTGQKDDLSGGPEGV